MNVFKQTFITKQLIIKKCKHQAIYNSDNVQKYIRLENTFMWGSKQSLPLIGMYTV